MKKRIKSNKDEERKKLTGKKEAIAASILELVLNEQELEVKSSNILKTFPKSERPTRIDINIAKKSLRKNFKDWFQG